jgi:hypothetical protein
MTQTLRIPGSWVTEAVARRAVADGSVRVALPTLLSMCAAGVSVLRAQQDAYSPAESSAAAAAAAAAASLAWAAPVLATLLLHVMAPPLLAASATAAAEERVSGRAVDSGGTDDQVPPPPARAPRLGVSRKTSSLGLSHGALTTATSITPALPARISLNASVGGQSEDGPKSEGRLLSEWLGSSRAGSTAAKAAAAELKLPMPLDLFCYSGHVEPLFTPGLVLDAWGASQLTAALRLAELSLDLLPRLASETLTRGLRARLQVVRGYIDAVVSGVPPATEGIWAGPVGSVRGVAVSWRSELRSADHAMPLTRAAWPIVGRNAGLLRSWLGSLLQAIAAP